ncbi:MAG: hypothetical protein JOZ69_14045 [Myxococcales bacterium]|nr:hypothetical protein [Myxococcales bacterium]
MKLTKKALLVVAAMAVPTAAWAANVTAADVRQRYAAWLQDYADRRPADAIALTSDDFVMVDNGATALDRAQALAFTEGLAQFILSRECTNEVVTEKELPGQARLLVEHVVCTFHTVQGDLPGDFVETIIVDKKGTILFDQFSDVATPL